MLIQEKINTRLKKQNLIPNSMIMSPLEYIEELTQFQTLSIERK
jgi:hypothetical protein